MNEMFKSENLSKVINTRVQVPASNTESTITAYLKKNQQYIWKRVMHAFGQNILNHCRKHNIQKRQNIQDYIYCFMKQLMNWFQKGDSVKFKQNQANENIQKLQRQLKKNSRILKENQKRLQRRNNKINKMQKLMNDFYEKLCEDRRKQNIKTTENTIASQKAFEMMQIKKTEFVHKLVKKLLTEFVHHTIRKNQQINAKFLKRLTEQLVKQINQMRNQKDKYKHIGDQLLASIQEKNKQIKSLKQQNEKLVKKQNKSNNIMRQQTKYLNQISKIYKQLQNKSQINIKNSLTESIINKQKISTLHELLTILIQQNKELRRISKQSQQQYIRIQQQHLHIKQQYINLSNKIKDIQLLILQQKQKNIKLQQQRQLLNKQIQNDTTLIKQLSQQMSIKQMQIKQYKQKVDKLDKYAIQIECKQQCIAKLTKELECLTQVKQKQERELVEMAKEMEQKQKKGQQQMEKLTQMHTINVKNKQQQIARINKESAAAINELIHKYQEQKLTRKQSYLQQYTQTHISHSSGSNQKQTNTTPPIHIDISTSTQKIAQTAASVWTQSEYLEVCCVQSSVYNITVQNIVKQMCQISTLTENILCEQEIVEQYGFMDQQQENDEDGQVRSVSDRGIQTSLIRHQQQQQQISQSSSSSQYVYQIDIGTQYKLSDIGQQYPYPSYPSYPSYPYQYNNNKQNQQQQPTFTTYTSYQNYNIHAYNQGNMHDDGYNININIDTNINSNTNSNNPSNQCNKNRHTTCSTMDNNSSMLQQNCYRYAECGVQAGHIMQMCDTYTQSMQVTCEQSHTQVQAHVQVQAQVQTEIHTQSLYTIQQYIQQIHHLQLTNNTLQQQQSRHCLQIQQLSTTICGLQNQLSLQHMTQQTTHRQLQHLKLQHTSICSQLAQYKHRLRTYLHQHEHILHRHEQQVQLYQQTIKQLNSKVEEYRASNQNISKYNQQLLETIQYANSLFSGGCVRDHKAGGYTKDGYHAYTKNNYKNNNANSNITYNFTESTKLEQDDKCNQYSQSEKYDRSEKSDQEGLLISRYQCQKDQILSSQPKQSTHEHDQVKNNNEATTQNQLQINRNSVSRLLAEFVNAQNREDNRIAAFTTLVSMLNPNGEQREKFDNYIKFKKIKSIIQSNQNDNQMRERFEKYNYQTQDIQDKLYRFFTQN